MISSFVTICRIVIRVVLTPFYNQPFLVESSRETQIYDSNFALCQRFWVIILYVMFAEESHLLCLQLMLLGHLISVFIQVPVPIPRSPFRDQVLSKNSVIVV